MQYFKIILLFIYLFIFGCVSENNLLLHEKNGRLLINECMVRNSIESGIHDGDSVFSDWVELYNCSDDTIYLGDFYLSDQINNLFKFQLPLSFLLPGEFFLLWGGSSNTSPETHIGFNFSSDSSKGEMILLTDFIGNIVDSLNYNLNSDALKRDKSFGRKPDGASRWCSLELATPGYSNIR